MSEQLMILVAGPYRSGTNDDAVLIQRNVDAMEDMALAVFRRGHLPVLGEWFALPLLKHAGSRKIGDAVFDEIFHPIARELLGKCDAVPGFFHVATRFFHINFVPLIPIETYLVLSRNGNSFRGVKIPMSGKTVGLAWGRFITFVASVWLAIGTIVELQDVS